MDLNTVKSGPFGPQRGGFVIFLQSVDFLDRQGPGDLPALVVKQIGRRDRHLAIDEIRRRLPAGMGQLQKDFGAVLVHCFHQFFIAIQKPFMENTILRNAGPAQRMGNVGMTGHDQADTASRQVAEKLDLRIGHLAARLHQPIVGCRTHETIAERHGADLIRFE